MEKIMKPKQQVTYPDRVEVECDTQGMAQYVSREMTQKGFDCSWNASRRGYMVTAYSDLASFECPTIDLLKSFLLHCEVTDVGNNKFFVRD